MIEFRGEISESCKKYILKRTKLISFSGLIIGCYILCIPMIILTITYHWIFSIAVATLILLPLLAFIPPTGKSLELIYPTSVYIDIKNNLAISKGSRFCHKASLTYLKKIVDYGEWYHLFFKVGQRSQNFVCQKDLLIQGSLEDFENTFKDKIKYPKKKAI